MQFQPPNPMAQVPQPQQQWQQPPQGQMMQPQQMQPQMQQPAYQPQQQQQMQQPAYAPQPQMPMQQPPQQWQQPQQQMPMQQPQQGFRPPTVPVVPTAPMQQQRGGRPAAVSLEHLFGGLDSARMHRGGNYDKAGVYWERIDKIKVDANRQGVPFFAVEKTCVKVLNDGGTGRKPGEQYSSLFRQGDYFLSDLKGFLCGVLGVPEDQCGMPQATWAASAEQPLAGMIVEMNNFEKTSSEGKPFTIVRYCRRVPFTEVLRSMPPDQIALFFKPGELEQMAAIEGGGAPAPQQQVQQPAYQPPQQMQPMQVAPPMQLQPPMQPAPGYGQPQWQQPTQQQQVNYGLAAGQIPF